MCLAVFSIRHHMCCDVSACVPLRKSLFLPHEGCFQLQAWTTLPIFAVTLRPESVISVKPVVQILQTRFTPGRSMDPTHSFWILLVCAHASCIHMSLVHGTRPCPDPRSPCVFEVFTLSGFTKCVFSMIALSAQSGESFDMVGPVVRTFAASP